MVWTYEIDLNLKFLTPSQVKASDFLGCMVNYISVDMYFIWFIFDCSWPQQWFHFFDCGTLCVQNAAVDEMKVKMRKLRPVVCFVNLQTMATLKAKSWTTFSVTWWSVCIHRQGHPLVLMLADCSGRLGAQLLPSAACVGGAWVWLLYRRVSVWFASDSSTSTLMKR